VLHAVHIFSQYGEIRPTSGWNLLASLGQSSKFQRVSHLGSITAWHSSSGRQPKFVALNRGRHLHSAGWSSRWTLDRILVRNVTSTVFRWISRMGMRTLWPGTGKDVDSITQGHLKRGL